MYQPIRFGVAVALMALTGAGGLAGGWAVAHLTHVEVRVTPAAAPVLLSCPEPSPESGRETDTTYQPRGRLLPLPQLRKGP